MSVEQNKAAIRRNRAEVANKGNLSIIPELVAPNYILHSIPEVKGPEGFKQNVITIRTALPDLHVTIDNIVAEGDMVAAFCTDQGTFKGKYGDIAPTGKKIKLATVTLSRFKDGKEVEAWQYGDMLAFYRQAGVPIPPA